jgi:osmotically-inducible protein OsmY
MINRTTSITRFVIGLLLVALMAGCAGSATQESTGEYIDDSGITASVKAAIYKDPMLKVGQISVESHKGVVQLSGFVDSRQAATRAVELARSVKGVKSVENSLIVK